MDSRRSATRTPRPLTGHSFRSVRFRRSVVFLQRASTWSEKQPRRKETAYNIKAQTEVNVHTAKMDFVSYFYV